MSMAIASQREVLLTRIEADGFRLDAEFRFL